MKDFLEALEIGEAKAKLSAEQIKEILKKHGEYIKTEVDKVDNKYKEQLEENKNTISDLKEQIEKAPKTDEIKSLQDKIADYEQKEADRTAKEKAKAEDELLTNNIVQAFGDKKFTSDYARNGLISDIKLALNRPENKGKGISDLIDELSKDKNGIFETPNKQVDLPGANENVDTTITKDSFEKMSYNERLQLKKDNPDLFKKLNE